MVNMTPEELIKLITSAKNNDGKVEDLDTIIEGITDVIDAEKQRGIKASRKKDKDVMKLKASLKEIGYNKDDYDDVDEFISTINSKLKKPKDDGSKSKIAQLSEKLDDVIGQLDKERELSTKLRKSSSNERMTNKLTDALGDKLYGSQYVIESLISTNKVSLDSDNNIYFKGIDEDDVISFDKGISQVLDDNKDMRKVSQTQGSGDNGGDNVIDKDIESMSVKDTLAHLSEIKEQMGISKK